MSSRPIFISHAVANKELADKFVDLLETGIGIADSNIFCSSLEGIGIPSGSNFVEFIRQQIKEPKVVILLLTKEYFKSQFCLSELGASWVLGHNAIPLLVPPLEYKDIKAVLTGVQVRKIHDKNDLNEIQEELITWLDEKGKAFAKWEVKRDKFLKEIPEFFSTGIDSDTVSVTEHNKLKNDYNDAVEEMKISEEEIEKRDQLIESLKKVKDKSEVTSIIAESLTEIETFEELTKKCKKALSKLPSIVQGAIYYELRDEALEWPGFGEDYDTERIKDAIKEDYLSDTGEGITLVEEDPNVSCALNELYELQRFCSRAEEEYEDFYEYYMETYDHRLNFQSKRFWDANL